MSIIREILYILYLRRRLLIIPGLFAPFLAVVMIVFREPIYLSKAKVWVKERPEESVVLRTSENSLQERTHIEVQKEIISSFPVLKKVVERLNLIKPAPSQSIWARVTGRDEVDIPDGWDQARALLEAVQSLQDGVALEILNAEVISITIKMNSPELAQRVNQELLAAYQEAYLTFLQNEIHLAKQFLEGRLYTLKAEVAEKEKGLLQFQESNPDLVAAKFSLELGSVQQYYPPEPLSDVAEYNPIPALLQDQGRLQMRLNKLLTTSSIDNFELQQVKEEIARNTELIEKYRQELIQQAKLSLRHKDLQWMLEEERGRYHFALNEFDKVVISQGTRAQQAAVVTILEDPTYNPEKISPKMKITMIAAGFLGAILGLSMIYLFEMLDNTYHLAVQVRRDLSIPVLGELFIEDEERLQRNRED